MSTALSISYQRSASRSRPQYYFYYQSQFICFILPSFYQLSEPYSAYYQKNLPAFWTWICWFFFIFRIVASLRSLRNYARSQDQFWVGFIFWGWVECVFFFTWIPSASSQFRYYLYYQFICQTGYYSCCYYYSFQSEFQNYYYYDC